MRPLYFLKPFLPMALLSALFSGCAPTTLTTYKLEPASGDIVQLDGRPVTKADRNGVTVVASFEREELDYVALDVEIKNNTDQPIEVNPADFHFYALGAQQDTLADPAAPDQPLFRGAADPLYEASRMGLKRKQEEKRLKQAKVINTILLVAAIASDVSSTSRSRTRSEWISKRVSHDVAYQAIAAKRAIDHGTFANRMQRYDYEEYRWRELALRANTLKPGESVRGFVYLPKQKDARYLAITYSIPETVDVPLLFKQQTVEERQRKKRR